MANGGTSSARGGGGGGRIALHANIINFNRTIENKGGLGNIGGGYNHGSGGTVYINATNYISGAMNVSVVGYNGSSAGNDWGQRINLTSTKLTLTGIYNASVINLSLSGVRNGTITLDYDNCDSSFGSATFSPTKTDITSCPRPGVSFTTPPTPANASTQGATAFLVNLTTSDNSSTGAEEQTYAFVDFDDSLVGWWRLDNDYFSAENATLVKDWSEHQCYDNETEILTLEEVDCGNADVEFVEVNGEIFEIEDYEELVIDNDVINGELNYGEDKDENYNEKQNEAFDLTSEELSVMHNLTDCSGNGLFNYINLSKINIAEDAPEALSVMRQVDTLCLHRLPGSTPGWGASALDNENSEANKLSNNERENNKLTNEENKKGSNRMVEPNPLIPDNICGNKKYLNISVDGYESHAGMAEWLLQSADTGCP